MYLIAINARDAAKNPVDVLLSDTEFHSHLIDPDYPDVDFIPFLDNAFEFASTLDGLDVEIGPSLPNFGGFGVHMQRAGSSVSLVHLLDYDFWDAPVTIKYAPDPKSRLVSSYWQNMATAFTGRIDLQPTVSGSRLVFTLAAPEKLFQKPVTLNTYAGDSQPEGSAPFVDIEGDEDIKGRPKPRCIGYKSKVVAVLVNKNGLIYQIDDGAVQAIPAVYDNENALVKATGPSITDGDMSDANFDAWTGNPGEYVTNVNRGLFRLGGRAFGEITADVEGHIFGAAGFVSTHSEVMEELAKEAGHTNFDATALAAHLAADSAPIGVYVSDETSYYDLLTWLANSCGSYWSIDEAGDFAVTKMEGAAGTASQTILDGASSSWARTNVYKPFWRWRLGYGGVRDIGTGTGGGGSGGSGGGPGGGGGAGDRPGGGGGIIKDEQPPIRPPIPVIKRKSRVSAVQRVRFAVEIDGSGDVIKDEGGGPPVSGPEELVVVAEDTDILADYPAARDSELISTYYATEAGAQAEANRRLNVWSIPRHEWQSNVARLQFTPRRAETYEFWDARFFPAGKRAIVLGTRSYSSRQHYRLTVLF